MLCRACTGPVKILIALDKEEDCCNKDMQSVFYITYAAQHRQHKLEMVVEDVCGKDDVYLKYKLKDLITLIL